jgi:hypothetical protein
VHVIVSFLGQMMTWLDYLSQLSPAGKKEASVRSYVAASPWCAVLAVGKIETVQTRLELQKKKKKKEILAERAFHE